MRWLSFIIVIVVACQLFGYTYNNELVINATNGNAQSSFELGACYDSGFGVEVDKTEAVKWYTQAAEKGHPEALYYLGWKYHLGTGISQSDSIAIKLWKQSAESGHILALVQMGLIYYDGQLLTQDYYEAFRYSLLAAEKGDMIAQSRVGTCYYYGYGCTKDLAQAFKWYKLSADQDYTNAEYNTGLCYRYGYGVAIDESAAFRYYLKAAKAGHSKAQTAVSLCYEQGKGVAKSIDSSEVWLIGTKFEEKAESGDPEAQYLFGLFLYKCCKDKEAAIKWLRLSESQDYPKAALALGDMYLSGEAEITDNSEAFRWYKIAADKGVARAKYLIGHMYYLGLIETETDHGTIYWLKQAADAGDMNANYQLGQIYSQGSGIGTLDLRDILEMGSNRKKVSGIIQNDREAIKYLERAAEKGHHNAQLDLADLYDESLDNNENAYFWLLIANAHEFDSVKEIPTNLLDYPNYNRKLYQGDWLDEVGSNLTVSVKIRVQDAANKWLQSHPGADKYLIERWWKN